MNKSASTQNADVGGLLSPDLLTNRSQSDIQSDKQFNQTLQNEIENINRSLKKISNMVNSQKEQR